MRIQETDRILKESRYARHAAAQQHETGLVERAKRFVSKLTSMFRKDG